MSPNPRSRLDAPISILQILMLSLWVLLGAIPMAAQDPSESFNELFGESVDVRVVNLEVVVEQKGERVFGLSVADFVLKVDGEEVPVEFFSEVQGGASVGSVSSDDGAVPAMEPGEPVGTRYLVFIDDVFTLKAHRNRVLRNLRDDLPRLKPEDHMAMVAYGGKSIDLLSSWTRSQRDLERAIHRAEDRPAHGLRQRSLQRFDDDFRRFGGRGFSNRYGRSGNGRGQRSYAEVQEVVAAASSTLRAFAQPDGRRVLLFVSGSWPAVGFGSNGAGVVDYARSPGRRFFAPLVDAANLLGYTVYPIDVAGVEAQFADASYGSSRQARYAQEIGREREWAQESNLVEIAERTGGRALLDGASSMVLEKVEQDTRSYYSIGFTPNWQANDQRHRVDVEVPGLRRVKVRLRDSFTDLSARTESTLRLESAQLFDLPLPSSGRLVVEPGTPVEAGWRKVVLPLQVKIPLDGLTYLPTAEGYATRVELRVAVTDDRGDRADIPVVPLVIERPQRPSPGDTEIYVARLKMRQRPHRLLVSLLDPASGEELSARLEVDPGSLIGSR